jgi:hypothetical protein
MTLNAGLSTGRPRLVFLLALSVFGYGHGAVQCSDFTDEVESPYWCEARALDVRVVPAPLTPAHPPSISRWPRVEAARCGDCVQTAGCGYCLSTLRCVEGTENGPSDGSPCLNWVKELGKCPGQLRAREHGIAAQSAQEYFFSRVVLRSCSHVRQLRHMR